MMKILYAHQTLGFFFPFFFLLLFLFFGCIWFFMFFFIVFLGFGLFLGVFNFLKKKIFLIFVFFSL
jgi:hypothetical protein